MALRLCVCVVERAVRRAGLCRGAGCFGAGAVSGRAPRDEERERLEHLAWLYDYVCVLWSELFAARGGTEAGTVLARARFLAERLSSSARKA